MEQILLLMINIVYKIYIFFCKRLSVFYLFYIRVIIKFQIAYGIQSFCCGNRLFSLMFQLVSKYGLQLGNPAILISIGSILTIILNCI